MPAPNRFAITADADRGDHIDASTLQPGDRYVREYTGTTTNPIVRLERRITDRTSTDLENALAGGVTIADITELRRLRALRSELEGYRDALDTIDAQTDPASVIRALNGVLAVAPHA